MRQKIEDFRLGIWPHDAAGGHGQTSSAVRCRRRVKIPALAQIPWSVCSGVVAGERIAGVVIMLAVRSWCAVDLVPAAGWCHRRARLAGWPVGADPGPGRCWWGGLPACGVAASAQPVWAAAGWYACVWPGGADPTAGPAVFLPQSGRL